MHKFILPTIFSIFILYLFIRSLKFPDKNYRNECVSIGILGTFTGITISLFNFNSESISSSLPAFLDGLKIAFVTSGLGVICSTILSFKKPDSEVNNLERLVSLQETTNEILSTSLSNIANSANKEIIKSLEEVIGNFNKHIELQLGENFADLNNAFKELVVWQNNYKESLNINHALLEKQYDNMLKLMKKIEDNESFILTRLENQHSKNLNFLNSVHEEGLSLIQSQSELVVEQAKGIEKIINNLDKSVIKTVNEMEDSVLMVNKRIKESVDIAEESITSLIGIANGKLK